MTQALFIAGQPELTSFLDELSASKTIAIDTEFVPEYTYFPHLCLIQVATPRSLAVIDTLAIDDLSAFWKALIRPDCEVILHAGKEELLFCLRETGQLPHRIFDVQLAAGLVGLGYPLSYSKLVQRVLGREAVSGETRTDWRRRPLSDRQIEYALDDVRYLHEIHEHLVKRLTELDRVSWFDEEMAANRNRLIHAEHSERWRKVSGSGSLSSRQSAVLRELWNWRDQRARELDKPVKWVIRDDLLIELAKRQPSTIEQMRQTRGMGAIAKARWADKLIEAIEIGRQASPPTTSTKNWRRDDGDDAMIQKLVSAAMVHLATEHGVAAALLGTNEDLRQLIDWHTKPMGDEPPILARGWRAKVCGNHLKDLLDGKVAIRIEHSAQRSRILFEPVDGT